MLIVTGTIEVPEGALDKARPAIRDMVAATLAEEGCITYGFWQDLEVPGRLRVYEEWRDRAALEAHFQSAHMAAFRETLGALGPVSRHIVAIEAGAVSPL